MKISELMKHLEYQLETFGDNEIMLSVVFERTCAGDVTGAHAIGDLQFTYFQQYRGEDVLIIENKLGN